MIALLVILNFFISCCFINGSWSHVGQPCNKFIRVCLARNSHCDEENICRCDPDYPVNISMHSCRKGKRYSEICEYTEECVYFDRNSYCSQLPYRSTCECHNGFVFSEVSGSCEKVGGDHPKPANLIFPTAIGIALAFASFICCCIVLWHVCKRGNFPFAVFSRNRQSQFLSTDQNGLRSVRVPTAPPPEEALPSYDTALSLKVTEDSEPPPSYEEVICHESQSKS